MGPQATPAAFSTSTHSAAERRGERGLEHRVEGLAMLHPREHAAEARVVGQGGLLDRLAEAPPHVVVADGQVEEPVLGPGRRPWGRSAGDGCRPAAAPHRC